MQISKIKAKCLLKVARYLVMKTMHFNDRVCCQKFCYQRSQYLTDLGYSILALYCYGGAALYLLELTGTPWGQNTNPS